MADTEMKQAMEPELQKVEVTEETKKGTREYKEPFSQRVKLAALDNFQKLTVDKIVQPNEFHGEMFSDDEILSLFDTTPEQQEAFLAEVKDKTESEELDLGLVEVVKQEVLRDMQETIKEKQTVYEQSMTVSSDTFVRIQMWSFFPIIGTVLYFLMLLAITVDRKGKYPGSLKNWAKAQLKFFWIYVLVTAIVVFCCVMAGISFMNIIQRGLRA